MVIPVLNCYQGLNANYMKIKAGDFPFHLPQIMLSPTQEKSANISF